ncbi:MULTISPECIES: hypothetical protein [Fusobacterium]|uniref:hypothetical protein n=1 Tax=Fusobacterium TaxID=848 RepID=UPI0030CBFE0F
MDLEDIFKKIVEDKYYQLNLDKPNEDKFSKIKFFEANAVGAIGEEFIKTVMSRFGSVKNDGTIHDEYDIQMDNNIKLEVKTARKGNNDTFQFNGINPAYNYDYLICIGVCPNKILYRIFRKNNIQYIHNKDDRGYRMIQKNFNKEINKKLVSMNPGNQVNLKLTLNVNDMYDICYLDEEIKKIMEK